MLYKLGMQAALNALGVPLIKHAALSPAKIRALAQRTAEKMAPAQATKYLANVEKTLAAHAGEAATDVASTLRASELSEPLRQHLTTTPIHSMPAPPTKGGFGYERVVTPESFEQVLNVPRAQPLEMHALPPAQKPLTARFDKSRDPFTKTIPGSLLPRGSTVTQTTVDAPATDIFKALERNTRVGRVRNNYSGIV